MRDSIGKRYIPGPEEGMYMITSPAFAPTYKRIQIGHYPAIESKGLWGGWYCFPQFDDKQTLLNFLKEQGITEYQEWVTFRHTFSHFHLDIHPIYVEVDRKSEEGARSDWKKLSEKGKESQSGLLSAVKYWYDPQNLGSIGLATPVKNLLTQYVRNRYGKNGIL